MRERFYRFLISFQFSPKGDSCSVDDNGIISNQNDCRFIPDSSGQTATRSLMSFHWIDSVKHLIKVK